MIPAIKEVMLAVGSSWAASIVAKVTVSTALALFAAWLARGRPAAVRHALLAAAFGVMLLLPIASVLLPPVPLAVPVAVENRASAAPTPTDGLDQTPPLLVTDDPRDRVISIPRSSRMSLSKLSHLLLAGWIAGGAIFLLPLVTGLWQIRLLRRSGLPWRHGQSLLETIARDAGVRRRVEVLLHETAPGPMTCGVVHPIIVLPRDAESWNEEDLSRAFMHELEHVRRGDSLSRSLARGACAVYWFHPLVRIAWRRLALEAERACDDAVLRRSEATAYADQLVGLAKRLYAAQTSPVPAMANRADLATRVHAVLDARQRRGRAGAFSLGLAAIAAIVLVISMSSLILVAAPQAHYDAASAKPFNLKAQDEPSREEPDPLRRLAQARPATVDRAVSAAPATPTFEVASIKPHVLNSGFHDPDCSGDRFISRGLGLMNLLSWAYDLQAGARTEFLQRVPLSMGRWYDFEAKADASVASESQCRLMVQALLADRFKLTFHYETRDADLFDLVVARGGSRLQKALPADEGSDVNIVVNGRPTITWVPIADPDERARTKGMTMEEFALRLPTTALAPIADKTALQGRYKIDLRYSTSLATDVQDTPVNPPLEAALAKLGLRLEKHKGSVKVPVLDHIEPPNPN